MALVPQNKPATPPVIPAAAAQAAGEYLGHGLVPGSGTGRGDTVKASVPPESYIVPADVVSGLGKGNTLAGAKVLDGILGQGNDQPPSAMAPPAEPEGIPRKTFATGGIMGMPPAPSAPSSPDATAVPIKASSGEYVVSPETCAKIGQGDLDYGHQILDNFVETIRKDSIKTLKDLPKPKG